MASSTRSHRIAILPRPASTAASSCAFNGIELARRYSSSASSLRPWLRSISAIFWEALCQAFQVNKAALWIPCCDGATVGVFTDLAIKRQTHNEGVVEMQELCEAPGKFFDNCLWLAVTFLEGFLYCVFVLFDTLLQLCD